MAPSDEERLCFNGKNFSFWKFRMTMKLRRLGLVQMVEQDLEDLKATYAPAPGDNAAARERKKTAIAELEKQDIACQDEISSRISPTHIEVVIGKRSAFDMWKALIERYQLITATSRVTLSSEFYSLEYKPKEESLEDFNLKFDRLQRELVELGDTTDSVGFVAQYLRCMPKGEYRPITRIIESVETGRLTMDFARQKIAEFENEKPARKSAISLPSVAFSSEYRNSRSALVCHNCGRPNHKAKECYRRGGGAFRTGAFKPGASRGNGRGRGRGRGRGGRGRGRGRGGYTWTNNNQQPQAHSSTSEPKEESNALVAYAFMGSVEGDNVIEETLKQVDWNSLICQGDDNALLCNVSVKQSLWLLDSGASNHLVRSDTVTVNRSQLKEAITIHIAKTKVYLKAFEKGDVILSTLVNGKCHKLILKDCLLVQDLKHNLVSISRLESNRQHAILFWDGKCHIYRERPGGEIAAVGLQVNYVYHLQTMEAEMESSFAGVGVQTWHERLGHLGARNLEKLPKLVSGVEEFRSSDLRFCDTCVQGKQTKLPHSGTRPKTTKPLQRIHSDLCGPITPIAYNGVRYLMTFLDDFTHFAVVFGLTSKTEAFDYIKIFEARVTARFSYKISSFRCDNGTEYINQNVQEFFKEKGIELEAVVPRTPELNGVAERLNRTILDKARCMLLGSKLTREFWIEAAHTAAFLLNRSPTSALQDKVPAEMWYGRRPDLSKLKTFGCIAFVHKPKELRSGKFDSRSKLCLMMGYSDTGYRLWSLEDKKIILGRNVIFDETRFKFATEDNLFSMDEANVENLGNIEVTDNTADSDDAADLPGEPGEENEDGRLHDNTQERDERFQLQQFREVYDHEEDEPTRVRRSTRVRLRPRHLNDYCVLANLATVVDNISEKEVLGCLANVNYELPFKIDTVFNPPSQEYDTMVLSALNYSMDIPTDFQDLIGRDDEIMWKEAVSEELKALDKNDTWSVVPLPLGKIPIKSKWVFTIKPDGDGNIERFKARLVIKGCAQRKGIDYGETYAPVARLSTVRTLLCIAFKQKMTINQLDVKCAFLNGILNQEIYMYPPEGMNVKPNHVCKLKKTLYGLKQAPMEWNKRFDQFVKEKLNFVQCISDRCLYFLKVGETIVLFLLLYVDDILLVSKDHATVLKIKSELKREFEMKDLGEINYFLGIKIKISEHGMVLNQTAYIKSVLKRFKMELCNPALTPSEVNPSQDLTGKCIVNEKPYRELIGCLMYACLGTRPDICAAVNFYSQFQSNATEVQWKGLIRILRYLKGTAEMSLYFNNKSYSPLQVYVDASFANIIGRKSHSGYIIKLFGDPVLWGTRKQSTVALSSTEAEYIALATALSELLWLRKLILEMGIKLTGPIPVYEDNQPAIHALDSWSDRRLKHIDIKYHFVRDLHRNQIIKVIHLPSEDQTADIMTKGLTSEIFQKHRNQIGLRLEKSRRGVEVPPSQTQSP